MEPNKKIIVFMASCLLNSLKITCFTKFRKEMLINRKLEELSISKLYIVKKLLLAAFQIIIEIQGVSFEKIDFRPFFQVTYKNLFQDHSVCLNYDMIKKSNVRRHFLTVSKIST